VISRPILTLFRRAPGFVIRHDDDFKGALGQKNPKGLTPKSGEEYLRALMRYHMIIDTAHMSDYSVRDTHAILDALNYPAIVSHAHFRAEGLYDEHATAEYKASEYDISDSNLTNVGRTGGVVGPFVAQPRINEESVDHHVLHIKNDCGNSSKGFAFSFHYGQEKASGSIGMATDFTFIPGVSPRFGEHACEGYKAVKHAKRPANDQPALQRHPVVYRGFVPPFGKGINQSEPMDPYRMDDRVFDFNYDGLAHFGLVPDMLQDVRNVGLPADDFQALFQSAEVYLRMWERVERTK
jgi:microsomal dipeptidase-like Zn-dependent dipeptidase